MFGVAVKKVRKRSGLLIALAVAFAVNGCMRTAGGDVSPWDK